MKTTVLPASGWSAATASIGVVVTSASKGIERGLVMRLGEEIDQRFGDGRTDAVDRVDLGPALGAERRRAQRGEIAEMAREAAGVGFADMADAERIEEAVDGDGPPRLDRREEIARREFAKAFALAEARPLGAVARLQA